MHLLVHAALPTTGMLWCAHTHHSKQRFAATACAALHAGVATAPDSDR